MRRACGGEFGEHGSWVLNFQLTEPQTAPTRSLVHHRSLYIAPRPPAAPRHATPRAARALAAACAPRASPPPLARPPTPHPTRRRSRTAPRGPAAEGAAASSPCGRWARPRARPRPAGSARVRRPRSQVAYRWWDGGQGCRAARGRGGSRGSGAPRRQPHVKRVSAAPRAPTTPQRPAPRGADPTRASPPRDPRPPAGRGRGCGRRPRQWLKVLFD